MTSSFQTTSSNSTPLAVGEQPESAPRSPWLVALLASVLGLGLFAVISTTLSGNQNDGEALAQEASGKTSRESAADTPAAKKEEAPVGADGQPLENPFPNRLPAPEFDGGTAWLNTAGEISLKDVRGKIVLLDFWTYCCINCMHVLPDLKYLEKKYPHELVVIGVHSAKFDNEKDTEAIRRAIVRYEIEHPVINDSEMLVWRKFGARAWPTIVLLDPEGNYCGYVSGEGNRDLLEAVIEKMIAYHKAKGTLDQTALQFDLERDRLKSGGLKFPGKILADEAGQRLFISDSNHNRIVVTGLDGRLQTVIGSGLIGAADGSFSTARFDHPQGLALQGDTLFVADTENHKLRQVDLKAGTVTTLAGTGQQSEFRARGGALLKTALNSPWDLEIVDGTLYVAMAGPHQIWSHKLGSDSISVFAGTGREDIIDGPHAECALAQPSGISSNGSALFVADSEGSAIRKIPLGAGDVTTIVGDHDLPNGRTLFEFGDVDAVGKTARLQHPLAVEHHDGLLFAADAYNHKIKQIDLQTRAATTWVGTGKPGTSLDPLQLHEPAGLAFAAGKVFIADTNNHRIVVVDMKTRAASELKIDGLQPPAATVEITADAGPPATRVIAVPVQRIKPGRLQLAVKLTAPEGYKLNTLAPVTARLTVADESKLLSAETSGRRLTAQVAADVATLEAPLPESGQGTIEAAVTWSYCRDGASGICRLHTSRFRIPVELAADGVATISLTADRP